MKLFRVLNLLAAILEFAGMAFIAATLLLAQDAPKAATLPAPAKFTVTLTVGDLLTLESSFLKVYRWEALGAQRNRIARWGAPIQAELERDEKSRAAFVQAHAKPNPDHQGAYDIDPAFVKAWNDMLADKVPLEITPLQDGDLDDVKMSAADMAALEPLLKPPGVEKVAEAKKK